MPPVLIIVSRYCCTTLVLNAAVTDLAASMVTVQLPVPVQAPDQPANVDPEAALAVRVMTAPEL